MKKILVPCDFSKPSINAFRVALDLAGKSKGTVFLINVIELPVISNPLMNSVAGFEHELAREIRKKTRKEYDKLIARYEKRGVTVKADVVFGSIAYMITDLARRKKVDLIVMGTHGTSGLRESIIGSNTEKVVRRATVPVLAIKDYIRRPVKNIVFPNALDNDQTGPLVKKVVALQAFFKAKLHVLYVNTPAHFTADNVTMERLKAFADKHKLRNYSLNVYNYPFEEPGILYFAESIKADMIAMGTHGRQGIAHFLNGSLAEDVVNHSKLPIWTASIER